MLRTASIIRWLSHDTTSNANVRNGLQAMNLAELSFPDTREQLQPTHRSPHAQIGATNRAPMRPCQDSADSFVATTHSNPVIGPATSNIINAHMRERFPFSSPPSPRPLRILRRPARALAEVDRFTVIGAISSRQNH